MFAFYIDYIKLFLLWFVLEIINIAIILVISIILLYINFIILPDCILYNYIIEIFFLV